MKAAYSTLTLSGAIFLLSGCLETGPQEYDRVCRSSGYSPGTAAYNTCWEQARQRRIAGASSLIGMGAGMMSAPPPAQSSGINRQIVNVNGQRFTCREYATGWSCNPLTR